MSRPVDVVPLVEALLSSVHDELLRCRFPAMAGKVREASELAAASLRRMGDENQALRDHCHDLESMVEYYRNGDAQ